MTSVVSLPAAGRELDALVAEQVMGWVCCGDARNFWHTGAEYRTLSETSYGSFAPSTDIAAAWEVVAKMLETHTVDVNAIPGESVIQWGVTMQKMPFAARYPEHGACAKTAPEAICLCALQAVAAFKAVAP